MEIMVTYEITGLNQNMVEDTLFSIRSAFSQVFGTYSQVTDSATKPTKYTFASHLRSPVPTDWEKGVELHSWIDRIIEDSPSVSQQLQTYE